MIKGKNMITFLMVFVTLFSTINVFAETDKLTDMVKKYDSTGIYLKRF